jgi:hypothetical protein
MNQSRLALVPAGLMRQRCSETLAEKKATDEKLTLLADSEVDVAQKMRRLRNPSPSADLPREKD